MEIIKKIAFVSVLFLGFFSLKVDASPVIKGKLIESGKNSPVEFATIILFKQETPGEVIAQSYSDEGGRFTLEGVKEGTYSLMVRLVGYDVWVRQVALTGKENQIWVQSS